jgi:hypothetical protein
VGEVRWPLGRFGRLERCAAGGDETDHGNPVRRRVLRWVDRRFNRSRYDAQLVVDSFIVSLRNQVDGDSVVDGWVGVVSETMQPASVGISMRG